MPNRQEEEAFELLAALEDETPDEVRAQRHHDRQSVRAHAWISEKHTGSPRENGVQAAIGDVSASGCRLLIDVPLAVGQLYRLEFDGESIELGTAFGRVVRCKLVAEDSFDTGIQFFGPCQLLWESVSIDGPLGL